MKVCVKAWQDVYNENGLITDLIALKALDAIMYGPVWEIKEFTIDIAEKLVKLTDKPSTLNYTYDLEDSIKTKIEKVAKKIYGAKGVDYSEEALKTIAKIEELGYGKYPVCIAKTQYSFSDDPKNLECKGDFNINVRDVVLKTGAGFVVVLAGNIMTMPGLPKVPAAESIDIDENGEIVGIF